MGIRSASIAYSVAVMRIVPAGFSEFTQSREFAFDLIEAGRDPAQNALAGFRRLLTSDVLPAPQLRLSALCWLCSA